MRKSHRLIILLLPMLLVVQVFAQATCETVIDAVLERLENICADLDRNTACYGIKHWMRSSLRSNPTVAFASPADAVPVNVLSSLQAAPLTTTSDQWGIAVMNIQANIPDTLPGQGVIFLVMGGAQLTDTSTDEMSPMQSVYFNAGIGEANCNEAPPTVAIQSPENIQINLTINGMDVTIGSTIIPHTD